MFTYHLICADQVTENHRLADAYNHQYIMNPFLCIYIPPFITYFFISSSWIEGLLDQRLFGGRDTTFACIGTGIRTGRSSIFPDEGLRIEVILCFRVTSSQDCR